jgi:hypothetical protein
VNGSTKIDVVIPGFSFVVLAPGSDAYLAIAGLTGGPLMPGQTATFTFTFTDDKGDATSSGNLAVPVAVPLSPQPTGSG